MTVCMVNGNASSRGHYHNQDGHAVDSSYRRNVSCQLHTYCAASNSKRSTKRKRYLQRYRPRSDDHEIIAITLVTMEIEKTEKDTKNCSHHNWHDLATKEFRKHFRHHLSSAIAVLRLESKAWSGETNEARPKLEKDKTTRVKHHSAPPFLLWTKI